MVAWLVLALILAQPADAVCACPGVSGYSFADIVDVPFVVVQGAVTYSPSTDRQLMLDELIFPAIQSLTGTAVHAYVPASSFDKTLVLTAFQTFPRRCIASGTSLDVSVNVVAGVCLFAGCVTGYQTFQVTFDLNVICSASPVQVVVRKATAGPVRLLDLPRLAAADLDGNFMTPVLTLCRAPGCTVTACQPSAGLAAATGCSDLLAGTPNTTISACGLADLQLCAASMFSPAAVVQHIGDPTRTVAAQYGIPRHAVCFPDSVVFFVDVVCGLTRMSAAVRAVYSAASNITTFNPAIVSANCTVNSCNATLLTRGSDCPTDLVQVRHTCNPHFPSDVAHVYTTGFASFSTSNLSAGSGPSATTCVLPIASACPAREYPAIKSIRIDTIVWLAVAGAALLVSLIMCLVMTKQHRDKTVHNTDKQWNTGKRHANKTGNQQPLRQQNTRSSESAMSGKMRPATRRTSAHVHLSNTGHQYADTRVAPDKPQRNSKAQPEYLQQISRIVSGTPVPQDSRHH